MTILEKWQLLEHYASREPKRFMQFDGWIGKPNDESDCVVKFDADGHSVTSGETWELMHGADVRVLIRPGTPVKHACDLLAKIAKWIEQDAADAELAF